jgi:uncharacterized protein (TIGR00369 family)
MGRPDGEPMTLEQAQALLAEVDLHGMLGLTLVHWGDGEVAFSFAPPAFVRARGGGAVHGGAIATALDTAACFALISTVGVDCSTIDLRTDFLRPALDAELVVQGSVVRAGRRFGCAQATLSTREGRELAAARGTFTWAG